MMSRSGPGSNGEPMIHVCSEVLHVVRDGRAESQVADAVVARRVLAAVVANADDGGALLKRHHPDLRDGAETLSG